MLVPDGLCGEDVPVKIRTRCLEMGLKDAPPIARFVLYDEICVSQSTWRLEDGWIWASLCKPNDKLWPKLFVAMSVNDEDRVDFAACRNMSYRMKRYSFRLYRANFDTNGMD